MIRSAIQALDERGPGFGLVWGSAATALAALSYLALAQPAGYETALTAIAVAAPALAAVYPLAHKPVRGLVLLVPAAVTPALPMGDASISFFAVPVLAAAWLAAEWAHPSAKSGAFRRATTPLLWFLAVSATAMIVGRFGWFDEPGAPNSAQAAGLALPLFSFAAFAMAARELRNARWLERSVQALVACGLVFLLTVLVVESGLATIRLAEPGALGSMFFTWVTALSFAQGLLNRRLTAGVRALYLSAAGGTLLLTMGPWSDWMSGWFPGLVAVGVISLLRFPRHTALLVLLAAAIVVANPGPILDWVLSPDQLYSSRTRTAAAETLYQIAKESPLIGFGPSNYYHYTQLFPILGWYVKFSSHNNYFDVILQSGLAGLAALLWFWGTLAGIGLRALQTAADGFPRAYVYGAVGGLAGTIVAGILGDWFLPFVYNVGLRGFGASVLAWIFLGGLVAMADPRTGAQRMERSAARR